jgi:hypothetical protein
VRNIKDVFSGLKKRSMSEEEIAEYGRSEYLRGIKEGRSQVTSEIAEYNRQEQQRLKEYYERRENRGLPFS